MLPIKEVDFCYNFNKKTFFGNNLIIEIMKRFQAVSLRINLFLKMNVFF